MGLNSRFMFDLPHYQANDGPGLTLHALPMVPSRWDRLTTVEVMGIRTTSELIEKVEESYSLSHEQATRDVEFWALSHLNWATVPRSLNRQSVEII